MNHSTPGLPVHHQFPEFIAWIHVCLFINLYTNIYIYLFIYIYIYTHCVFTYMHANIYLKKYIKWLKQVKSGHDICGKVNTKNTEPKCADVTNNFIEITTPELKLYLFFQSLPFQVILYISSRISSLIWKYNHILTSLVAQMVKRLPTMWETCVQSLGWEDPLEKVFTYIYLCSHMFCGHWRVKPQGAPLLPDCLFLMRLISGQPCLCLLLDKPLQT